MSYSTMLDSITCCQSSKGYDFVKQQCPIKAHSSTVSSFRLHCPIFPYSHYLFMCLPSNAINYRIGHSSSAFKKLFGRSPLFASLVSGSRGIYYSSCGVTRQKRHRICAALEVADAVDVINDLGLDTLTFLAVTVMVVPAFRIIKSSPILGFFFAGVVLNQFGLIRNLTDVKVLSEWGILFLLFEMGLELSLGRLKALAKFAFGMGLTQVVLSTLAFTAFELPPNGAIGTKILEFLFHSRSDLVNIRSIDEAIVIGSALSLSSSAFVLQLLAEKGELPTRFGSATLGILLLQDIAVVPLLVILPVLETQNLVGESILPMLAKESLKALGGLGLLSLGGKYLLRRVFEVVAEARSSEAFVALCLLTVSGTSLITQKLGFSDTLGAFLAGAILAETNFRTQIEADIRPFRGLLLGLFFVITGTSIDTQLLFREWPNVLALLGGLIIIKALIITAIGPRVGLTLKESVRIGFLLSQGGEFGFVVFSLANRLGVLPLELNKLLIIVVVLSMALTPLLNEVGRRAADFIDDNFDTGDKTAETVNFDAKEPVIILGFGQMGQVLANFLATPLASGETVGWPYVAFDLNLSVVKASRKLGFQILYGDGSRPAVLQSAGISSPKAVMVMYKGKEMTLEAVQRLRLAFPSIPIYARAQDLKHLLDLKKAGATDAILENAETSLQLGSKLLKGFGVMSDDVTFLRQLVRDSMELQAQEELSKTDDREYDTMKPLQMRVADLIGAQAPVPSTSPKDILPRANETVATHVLRSQAEVSKAEIELRQSSKDLEGKGVLYCELDTEIGFPVKTAEDGGEKNVVDPSTACVKTIDEH
ncbi:Na_H_Exchanger domain-containing protein/TrkA_N domain-containing protein [Cephalotus follicularis]|uniref:Na_H_Exchanger domain-containing protein/TrkA_N domain-containing protein n=1 Tax=Cephalotus follicularis TaxID=3775 RepID=A0A1Q3BAV2_CEPFO|nr:Na_H_Exchanger domain-containing protein/TrkA_N domain-containing protein [Cephalotus follicularis]